MQKNRIREVVWTTTYLMWGLLGSSIIYLLAKAFSLVWGVLV